jgi:hypothetical protein
VYNYKPWQLKYIELSSDITKNYTDIQLARIIGISRQSISTFKHDHPEIQEIIADNITKQTNKLGNTAMKALYSMMLHNPKALQIALELSNRYTPKNEVLTRYDTMDKKDVIKDIKNSFDKIMKQNDV